MILNARPRPAAIQPGLSALTQFIGLTGMLLLFLALPVPAATPAVGPASTVVPTTPEALAEALRQGFFSRVIEGSRLLLATNSKAPVYGLKGAAHAALKETEQANSATRRAQDGNEPNAKLFALNAQASLAHAGGSLTNAVTACLAAMKEDPNHPLAYVTLALVRHAETNFAAAAEQAEAAIQIEGRMALAHTALGQARQAQGNLPEAVRSFQNALRLDATDPRPHIGLGEIAIRAGNLPAAIQAYRAALSARPDHQEARETLGGLLLATGNPDGAMTEARLVLDRDSRSVPATLVLSRAYLQKNQFQEALEQAEKLLVRDRSSVEAAHLKNLCLMLLGRFNEARQVLHAAIQGGSKSPGTWLTAGIIEHLAGDFNAASNWLTQAREFGGTNWQGRVHFHLASVLLSAKQWDQATNELAQATGFFPASQLDRLDFRQFYHDAPPGSAAVVSLSAMYLVEGLLDPAIAALKDTTTKHPSNVIALYIASTPLARKGRPEEAITMLRQLNELAPRYAPAWFTAGEIQFSQRAFTNAIESFTRAAELDPKFVVPFFRLGLLHGVTKNYVQAERAYRQALELSPDSPLAANELANLLVQNKGDLEEALTLATRAMKQAPNDGGLIDTLGWVHYHQQDYRKALDAFQSAIQAQLDARFVPIVRYHLGLTYHKLGERDKALRELQEALKLSLNSPDAEDARALIKELEATQTEPQP